MEDAPRPIGLTVTSDPETTRIESAAPGLRQREGLGPVRLLYVADLHPGRPAPEPAEGGHRHTLDGARFAEFLAEQRPAVEVSVENHLGEAPARLSVTLEVDRLDALTPGGLAQRVPALRRARALRDALADARASRDALRQRLREEAGMGEAEADALVQALAAGARGEPSSGGDSALDRLLGLVDFEGNGAPPAASPSGSVLDTLVGAVSGSESAEIDRAAAGRLAADLDARLARQTDALLNAPEVRALEAAWRGLKFLVDRADFRGGLRLEVLAASKEDLGGALVRDVLWPEHEHGAERPPLAAIVLGHAYGHTPPEVEALADLASTGASLQVPVVASVDAAFFGFERPTDLSRLPVLRQHLATEAYLGFRKLRQSPDAQFLTLATPPFLLREPHALGGGEQETGTLWGGGALLAGAALLAAHMRTGWPCRLAEQRVEDLPVRKTRMGALPLAASFSDRYIADFAEAGVFAFRGALNRDHAEPGLPAVVRQPDRDAEPADARAHATLPAAVFSALAAHRVLRVQEELTGMEEGPAAEALEQRLRSFLGTADADAVTIQYLPEHDTDDTRTFGVRVWPPRAVLPHPVGVILGATVARLATA
jgi:type VI secretion system protein ImpC